MGSPHSSAPKSAFPATWRHGAASGAASQLRTIVAVSGSNIGPLVLPAQVARIVILAQRDRAGSAAERTLRRAIDRLQGQGIEVLLLPPPAWSRDQGPQRCRPRVGILTSPARGEGRVKAAGIGCRAWHPRILGFFKQGEGGEGRGAKSFSRARVNPPRKSLLDSLHLFTSPGFLRRGRVIAVTTAFTPGWPQAKTWLARSTAD